MHFSITLLPLSARLPKSLKATHFLGFDLYTTFIALFALVIRHLNGGKLEKVAQVPYILSITIFALFVLRMGHLKGGKAERVEFDHLLIRSESRHCSLQVGLEVNAREKLGHTSGVCPRSQSIMSL
jgi:hypothetical protein